MRQPRVLTLGLGTRPMEETIRILSQTGCRLVADVRTNPSAGFPPHYVRHLLVPSLEKVGMEYRWFRELGAMSEYTAPGLDGLLAIPDASRYAPRLNEQDYLLELAELSGVAASTSVVVVATEVNPRRCYRWILSDALFLKGIKVLHVVDSDSDLEHALSDELQILPNGQRIYQAVQLGIRDIGLDQGHSR